ncbi:TonB-dependent receptor [Parahaliea maris]|uniref:TonB-dependent receptor n=1 Tax=Parahaliea maris TaxID=2716870 RepID=A0A5C9A6E5_9GAMM|nr:TonB-dependent receptor [Parahaliea maris]TXS95582.1 TonB-dependent receptor [Parahaliea maris]
MAKRWVCLLLCLAFAVTSRAQSNLSTLGDLLGALSERGYRIVYSDSSVPLQQPLQQPLSGADVSLDSLRDVLQVLDLELRPVDGAWVIVRAEDEPPAEPSARVDDPPVLETVIVTGTLHRFPAGGTAASRFSFKAQDLSRLPSLASDALRASLRVPGVSSVGVSARPRVRGGLPDEVLVIQDGVELLEPFHLADYHSAYSAIDYRTVESLDFYTGGFPSRYGNRMSGVMDIRQQWQEEQYHTDLGVSSFANFVHHRGTFGEQHPGGWLFSWRQGDLSDLTDYIETRSGQPRYRDAGLRGSVDVSPQWSLSGGFVYSEDDIDFSDEEEAAASEVDMRYAWVGTDLSLQEHLESRFTLSWLSLDRRRFQASFEQPDPEDPEPQDPEKGGFLDHRQEVERLALRNDWSLLRGDWLWEAGWQADYSRADYRHQSLFNRGELADLLGSEREVDRSLRVRPSGWAGGLYLQTQWPLVPGLIVQPSLRWDRQDYYQNGGSDSQFSPRLGLRWELGDQLHLSLSLGRFHQPEAINELQVLDGVTEFFPAQESDQAVLGLYWGHGRVAFNVELYQKRYREQKDRFENIFNPFVLLPELEPDRVALSPDRARARGLDIDTALELTPSLTAVLRYSYMDASDRIDGRWVDRRWSQEQTVNAGIGWERDGFSIGLALTWHSGWRSSELPAFVSEDTEIPVASVLNNTQLREYFSLDLGVSKSWEIGPTRLKLYTDISNLTDRKNQAGIDFDIEEVDGGYLLLQDPETLLPRVVSVGATLSF